MPSNIEMRSAQRTSLFDLLKLKRDMAKEGISFPGLEALIIKAEAAMEEEDVALVEKKIAQLDLFGL